MADPNYSSHITARLARVYLDYKYNPARLTRQEAIELTAKGEGQILDAWFLTGGERHRVTHRQTVPLTPKGQAWVAWLREMAIG